MEQWVLLRKGADFEAIARKYHISPRLASLIRNREITDDAKMERYLNGTMAGRNVRFFCVPPGKVAERILLLKNRIYES